MDGATVYYVMGKMNELFNYYGDQTAAFKPIEQLLDKFVADGFIVRWQRKALLDRFWPWMDHLQ